LGKIELWKIMKLGKNRNLGNIEILENNYEIICFKTKLEIIICERKFWKSFETKQFLKNGHLKKIKNNGNLKFFFPCFLRIYL